MDEQQELERIHQLMEEAQQMELRIKDERDTLHKVFKQVRKHTDFTSVFELLDPAEGKKLLDICKAFAGGVRHLTIEYPRTFAIYRELARDVLQVLQEDNNIKVTVSQDNVRIEWSGNEWVHLWSEKIAGRTFLTEDNKQRLKGADKPTKAIKQALEDITTLLQMELHLTRYIDHIENRKGGYQFSRAEIERAATLRVILEHLERRESVNIQVFNEVAELILDIPTIDDARIFAGTRILTYWYEELNELLNNIQEAMKEEQKRAQVLKKRFVQLIEGDELIDKRMIIARYGIIALVAVGSGFLPYVNKIKTVFKMPAVYSKMKEDLAKADAKRENLERMAA